MRTQLIQEKTIQVLIIEDSRVDAIVLQRHLEKIHGKSIETEHATDLQQALGFLGDRQFDLIFLDNRKLRSR